MGKSVFNTKKREDARICSPTDA